MKRVLLMLFASVAGCSDGRDPPRGGQPRSEVLTELDSLPVGLEIIHEPAQVGKPEGPNSDDWPYRWRFRTEVRAIDRPLTITHFGIIAWDGSQWVLPPDQRHYNSGVLEKGTFAEWYHCPDATVRPGGPAVDPENWAGAYARAPFRQKWFFIGEDSQGQRFKGEGIVTFVTED
jgi:hypothetical protein